jgi:hypothetical protein
VRHNTDTGQPAGHPGIICGKPVSLYLAGTGIALDICDRCLHL